MSAEPTYTLWCDGIDCPRSVDEGAKSAKEARADGVRAGWKRKRVDGRDGDVCPGCLAGGGPSALKP